MAYIVWVFFFLLREEALEEPDFFEPVFLEPDFFVPFVPDLLAPDLCPLALPEVVFRASAGRLRGFRTASGAAFCV